MPVIKNSYGGVATIAVSLHTLGNAFSRESEIVDNTGTSFSDILLRIKTKGLSGATQMMRVYAYASLGDTAYTDLMTGTDQANTNYISHMVYLGAVQMGGTAVVIAGPFSLASAFGGVLPSKWGLVFQNLALGSLSNTAGDHVISYQGVHRSVEH